MGAWGTGNFENDNAGDWIWELEKSRDKQLLHETLLRVTEVEHPHAPECNEALAAADIVLAGLSGDHSQLPGGARKWITARTGLFVRRSKQFGSLDAQMAGAAVRQILDNSELSELWKETDDNLPWRQMQEKLLESLQSHA